MSIKNEGLKKVHCEALLFLLENLVISMTGYVNDNSFGEVGKLPEGSIRFDVITTNESVRLVINEYLRVNGYKYSYETANSYEEIHGETINYCYEIAGPYSYLELWEKIVNRFPEEIDEETNDCDGCNIECSCCLHSLFGLGEMDEPEKEFLERTKRFIIESREECIFDEQNVLHLFLLGIYNVVIVNNGEVK